MRRSKVTVTFPPDTYTAELACDGESWHVIHRKWKRVKKHQPRPAPIERIMRTFHGANAKLLAFAAVSRYTGKRGKKHAKADV